MLSISPSIFFNIAPSVTLDGFFFDGDKSFVSYGNFAQLVEIIVLK